MLWLYVK